MNKLSFVVCVTVVAMSSAGAAFAQATTAPASADTAATTAAAPDNDEMICESQAPTTGSLLGGQRICKTRKQWHDEQAQTDVGRTLERATVPGPMNPGH
jgi:hypothetical protein